MARIYQTKINQHVLRKYIHVQVLLCVCVCEETLILRHFAVFDKLDSQNKLVHYMVKIYQ